MYRNDWLETPRVYRTRHEFGATLTEFTAFACTHKADTLEQVTGRLVMQWRVDLVKAGKASATINKRLTAVSSYFKHCALHDAVAVNPFLCKRVEVQRTVERRRFTRDELVRLFTMADAERRDEMTLALLGMRQIIRVLEVLEGAKR